MTQDRSPERFAILRELGRGATGTLYAARDRTTGATVALRTLDAALTQAAGADLASAFLKNALAASRLRHANIVRVLDAGEASGTVYVAMELVEGTSLRQLLNERPLPVSRAIRIFDDVAAALAYAHEEGMVHRGVRPSSIFVLPSGLAKIGDFGVGQIGEAALPYLSPEQVRGDPVDARADLFSLGAVCYEMLTRRAPFGGSSPKEIRESILRAKPPRPSEANPNVPAALDAMVLGLLAPRPDDRVASARLLLRDLHRLEEGLGVRPDIAPVAAKTKPIASVPIPPAPPPSSEPPLDMPRFAARDDDDERFTPRRRPEPPRGSPATALAAFALALAVLSIALTVFLNDFPVPGVGELRALLQRGQDGTAGATAPPRAPEPAPPPVAEAPPPIAKPVTPPVPEPAPAAPVVERMPAPPPVETVAAAPPAPPVVEPPPAAVAAAPAKLVIAVSPRGDVYVDGKHYGTSPPIRTLELEPGMRRIEIRNGSRRPYLNYIVVEPGEERRIRYDFDARGRPPA